MTEQQQVQRAREASLVLDNPAYQEAMSQLKGQVIANYRTQINAAMRAQADEQGDTRPFILGTVDLSHYPTYSHELV